MEKRKTIIREYEVYHRLMRNAQVYVGDSLGRDVDLYDEEHRKNWLDFLGDPIVDVIFAESEFDAVKKISEDTGYHESNLYAVEHVVDAGVFVPISDKMSASARSFPKKGDLDKHHVNEEKIELRFTASSYDDGILSGIEIEMPDHSKMLICFDREDGQIKTVRSAYE